METVILCGGKGTRLRGDGITVPKPLVEIGRQPILWHLMKIYAQQGFTDFILCLGYQGELIRERFSGFKDWNITFVDTGQETPTGGRIKRAAPWIRGDRFFATYADGLADIDLNALMVWHLGKGKSATLTAVRPRSQFGILDIDEAGEVRQFIEKPVLQQWINGGFFVFERAVFDVLHESDILEKKPFERLAETHQLTAHSHHGFWKCMDTYKDNTELCELWDSGRAPWKIWP